MTFRNIQSSFKLLATAAVVVSLLVIFFTLAGRLLLESEWQQVYLSLQDSSQYFSWS